jgi:nucleoside-diphosphate-sugar epimerase
VLGPVLILGTGYTGLAVARLARDRGQSVRCHARSAERAATLQREGFEVLERAVLDEEIASHISTDTHVIITFPPDGATDSRIARALAHAHAITYVSSTGVYGARRGLIDDATPPEDPPGPRALRLLEAERHYRAIGAVILRAPGIYGPDRGLHVRIARGDHQIPGDGSGTISRIHVADLAALLLACSERHDDTFVVADLEPAPHIEVVQFVCREHGLRLPPSVPLESVHPSLRVDRRVDGSRALSILGVDLAFPSYRQGMARAATGPLA